MLLLLAAFSLVTQDPVTDLGVIEIRAQRLHPIIRVEVNPDAPVEAIVVSDPQAIRCGAAQFTYHAYRAPRQCWTRRLPGTEITLKAEAPASWDDSWRVEWQNCPAPNGRTCQVSATREDQIIKATFVR